MNQLLKALREDNEVLLARNSPLELTLFNGVEFNMVASSYPCAYKPNVPTKEEGDHILGYLVDIGGGKEHRYLDLSSSHSDNDQQRGLFRVYVGAIHSMNLLSPM